MRIGHYAPHVWEGGGIGTYIRRLGVAQLRRGHAVYFLSRHAPSDGRSETARVVVSDDELFHEATALSLDVLHLHKPVDAWPDERVATVRTMHGNQGGCPSGSRYLERTGQPCDRRYTVGGCLIGHLVDKCGSRRPAKIQANFRRIGMEHRLAAAMPTYTVSHFLRDQMVRAGCPTDNLYTLLSPAPEPTATFDPMPEDGPPRFLYVGRIVPQKGLDTLIRALSRATEDVRVDVAGDGPQLSAMREVARREGVSDRVTFHGWCSAAQVEALMQQARAVVFPSSWHEPAGLVTLEAAAAGRPVIASKVGGIPEYASEDFAMLVPPSDPNALAGQMELLARDVALAERMGRAGREAVAEKHSMDQFMNDLEAWYQHVAPAGRVVA